MRPSLKCCYCGAPLLSTVYWEEGRWPMWKCKTIKIAGLHRSFRCAFRGLLYRRKETYMQQQDRIEQEKKIRLAMRQLDRELES